MVVRTCGFHLSPVRLNKVAISINPTFACDCGGVGFFDTFCYFFTHQNRGGEIHSPGVRATRVKPLTKELFFAGIESGTLWSILVHTLKLYRPTILPPGQIPLGCWFR